MKAIIHPKFLYVGTKAVLAHPMTREEYNDYRGWKVPENENPSDKGFFVEYTDGGKPNHHDHVGYVSWSPADVFNQSYKPNGQLSFSAALELLKAGHKVARIGWNGKDQWLSISCPESKEVPASGFWSPHNAEFAKNNGGSAKVAPCITLKTAQNTIAMGWIPSTGDLFANDWKLVE